MSDEEILELFGEVDEPRSTSQVARKLRMSNPGAWKRLSDLYERGLLEKHPSSGLQEAAWSLSEAGRTYLEEETIPQEA